MPIQLSINHLVHVVRTQKNLGVRRPIEDTLHPGQPEMYAVLPYKVSCLSIHAPESANRG